MNYEKKKKKALEFYGQKSCVFIHNFSSSLDIYLASLEKIWRLILGKARTIELLLV